MVVTERDATQAMQDDIDRETQILAVKRRILKILRGLPDDEARRRVLGAAAVMLGHADAVLKPTSSGKA
jgi:hypothetical protein